jgi:hypothetical protein
VPRVSFIGGLEIEVESTKVQAEKMIEIQETRMTLAKLFALVPLLALLSACATSQPTSSVDAKRAAAAERIADRMGNRAH